MPLSQEVAHVIAKRPLLDVVRWHFDSFGLPLVIDRGILPPDDDPSTLFVCSGMQKLKRRFQERDGGECASLQGCVRTNDLDLVGDGTHLSYFEMLGTFSFGGRGYGHAVELWHRILKDLSVPVTHVTVHPEQYEHRRLWEGRGYQVVPDEGCIWSDGTVGGYCCEVFVGELEIGNLVNPMGHSVDVGFGLERLHQVLEGKEAVHQTSLFRQDVHPIVADHIRCLVAMSENGVQPGAKGRNYVCRRLVQRVARHKPDMSKLTPEVSVWVHEEVEAQGRRLERGRRLWPRHKDKTPEWWFDTHGLGPEDLGVIRSG